MAGAVHLASAQHSYSTDAAVAAPLGTSAPYLASMHRSAVCCAGAGDQLSSDLAAKPIKHSMQKQSRAFLLPAMQSTDTDTKWEELEGLNEKENSRLYGLEQQQRHVNKAKVMSWCASHYLVILVAAQSKQNISAACWALTQPTNSQEIYLPLLATIAK